MNLQEIQNKYNFVEYNNGGGCLAWAFDLDNNGHYILFTDASGLDVPFNSSDSFCVGCYNPDGDCVYIADVDNIDRVDRVIESMIVLWQANEDQTILKN